MASRSFIWLSIGGGAWSLASNWNDVTDGIDPSLLAPTAADDVTVAGPTGGEVETITGPGAAATAAFTGNTILAGDFAFGIFSMGGDGAGGLLAVDGGSLQTNAAAIASGSVVVSGAGSATGVAGTITLGTGQTGFGVPTSALDAASGGRVDALSLILAGSAAHIYVDPASIVEIGNAGTGRAGALTIDTGASAGGFGDLNAYGAVDNNGTITASGGTLLVGNLGGTGTLQIASGAVLTLNGRCAAGQTVAFEAGLGTLAIAAEIDTPAGLVTGFVPGCTIDMLGSPISAAIYAPTQPGFGVLTLTYGSQIAATITLAGDYTQDVFLLSGDGAQGTFITPTEGAGIGRNPSGGTPTPDLYSWIGTGSGRWNVNTSWEDITAGKNPANIAPGLNDLVTIAVPQEGFEVIAGPANAATLDITGGLALAGTFAIGALTVGDGPDAVPGTLDLLPGTAIATDSTLIADGAIAVTGAATSLSVARTLTLGGGLAGIGLPTATLAATSGGQIQAASLVLGGGSGDWITTDPTSSIEIGTAGSAAAGAFTVDPGATVTGNGSIDPYGSVVDNGSITALGGTLVLGPVTGTGKLAIASNATLELVGATARPIALLGPGAVLALASEMIPPTGTISGFVPGDAIDVLGSEIDAASYAAGTLTLFYGTSPVASLLLAGDFSNERFAVAPDGTGGTDILLASNGGGGGGGGQGNTDTLAWTAPVSGAWGTAGNWTDITTGKPASAPPGAKNTVIVDGQAGAGLIALGGPGSCANLTFTDNTLLSGAFTTMALQVGAPEGDGSLLPGFVEISGGATLSVNTATLTSGDLLATGTAASLHVAGTFTLGEGDLDAVAQATIQLGALVLTGGSVSTDSAATLEIGTAGHASAGALTIDAGSLVSGAGTLNALGAVLDGGTIAAAGGTLTVGDVSGGGMISIGTEATLLLAGTETCPIAFAGGGGTLIVFGSAFSPAGVIAGFAAGDSILIQSSLIDSANWQPGAGGTGTLTLSYGGQVAGTLRVAGDYAGDGFAVQPTDAGAVITLQPGAGGPPPGTPGPDTYVWTGAANTLWAEPGNWTDVTTGMTPALVAPGQHNLVTIQGPGTGYQTVIGPADAYLLALLGHVALTGSYAVGTLSVGQGAVSGLLALAAGSAIEAASGIVTGGIAMGGGALAVGGSLTLGGSSGDGVLSVTSRGVVTAGTLRLASAASVVVLDATSSIEIGGAFQAAAGTLQIDAGGLLEGAGIVNPTFATVDNGTIAAEGGQLALGAVSGTGTLLIGPGAGLKLNGTAGAGLVIDFTTAGTLTLADGMQAAAIQDFDPGCQIHLPGSGATAAEYAATGPGIGLLTIYAGSQTLDRLTLLGADPGAVYAATDAPDGGITVTVTPGQNAGGDGGGSMSDPETGPEDAGAFIASLPDYAQYWLGRAIGVGGNDLMTPYVWASTDGSDFGYAVPIYANIGWVTAPPAYTLIVLPPGYRGLIAAGNTPVGIVDTNTGGMGAVLVGNLGNDTIVGANNDTLVGGLGAQTVFAVNTTVTIQGGGNDIYNTGIGNVTIDTSPGHSIVALGPAGNLVTLHGTDTVACLGGNTANDTVDASMAVGQAVIFGPSQGGLWVIGGATPDIVVAGAGQVMMTGGSGGDTFHPNQFWCGSGYADFMPGTGASAVIEGSGTLVVGVQDQHAMEGTGPVTVYAGTGQALIYGAPGASVFVVGLGGSTVTAAAGNVIYGIGSANMSVTGAGNGAQVWALGSTGNDTLISGAGYETLAGGAGSDLFRVGSGQGAFEGMGGADTYAFQNGVSGGTATIFDFHPGTDLIGLQGYAGGANAVLATQKVVGGDMHLTLGDGTQITLIGITSLSSNAFTII